MLTRLKRLFGNKRGQSEQVVSALDTSVSPVAALSDADVPSSPQVPQQVHSVNVSPASAVQSTELSKSTVLPASVATAVDDRSGVISCFRVIYEALDDVLLQSQNLRTKRLDSEYDELTKLFSPEKLDSGVDIQYKSTERRFVYAYGYATTRATIICDVMERYQNLDLFQSHRQINVTCVGGGPGTELIGISKYLAMCERPIPIHATVWDCELGWEKSWQAIATKLNYPAPIHVQYQRQDFCSPIQLVEDVPVDLYTLCYCLCQFRKRHKHVEPFFARLFSDMPRGAYCLFVDINHPAEYDWIGDMAMQNGLEFLPADNGESYGHCGQFQMPTDETAIAETRLCGKMRRVPRLNPSISYRFCRKK